MLIHSHFLKFTQTILKYGQRSSKIDIHNIIIHEFSCYPNFKNDFNIQDDFNMQQMNLITFDLCITAMDNKTI